MTTPTKPGHLPDVTATSLLHDLRALTPDRQLSHLERLRLAELQATALRGMLGVTKDQFPIHLLRDVPRVCVRTVDDLPVSGLTFWGEHTWKIQIRSEESVTHRRFTVLHEFKHIIDHPVCGRLYDERAYVAVGERELVADHFAACVLLPAKNLKTACGSTADRRELARQFGVSGRQLALRMAELGLACAQTTTITERRIT
jgi:predicted transcriptional regulator